jgi:hypothetical protein
VTHRHSTPRTHARSRHGGGRTQNTAQGHVWNNRVGSANTPRAVPTTSSRATATMQARPPTPPGLAIAGKRAACLSRHAHEVRCWRGVFRMAATEARQLLDPQARLAAAASCGLRLFPSLCPALLLQCPAPLRGEGLDFPAWGPCGWCWSGSICPSLSTQIRKLWDQSWLIFPSGKKRQMSSEEKQKLVRVLDFNCSSGLPWQGCR